MRKLHYIFLILIACACNNNDTLIEHANQISNKIENRFAPDSREAIYHVNFSAQNNQALEVKGETSLPEAKLALMTALEELKVHLVDSLVVLPEYKMGDKVWGLINLSVVNLRAHPKHSAELVSQAIMGTPVKILKQNKSWYQVQTPDNYIAWVDSAALHLQTWSEMNTWRHSERVIFMPHFDIAKDANGEEIVTDIVAGSILQVKKKDQIYYYLQLPDSREIKINKKRCRPFDQWRSAPILNVSELTNTAKEFMGRPYLWGGTSSKGVDCSGFVKSVYFMNGIILARDASLQFLYGDTISPDQGYQKLKEGDLVFFGKKATDETSMKVTHVGMYIKDGEYIHASGRVKTNSFDPKASNYNDYRTVTWLGGRRVLSRIGESGLVRVKEHPWY